MKCVRIFCRNSAIFDGGDACVSGSQVIRPAVRQNDRADLDDMGKDIALPEVTQHAIMNYPLPDNQAG